MGHELYIEKNGKITATGVNQVEEFDASVIQAMLDGECLTIYGQNLYIESLDVESGSLIAGGKVDAIDYRKQREKKAFLSRFRK